MSLSHDSDSTENCNFSEDGWCQCQSNNGCLTSLDCTGWRPWGNAATGICPGPCQCEEEQAWNSVVPPRPNYQWVKNFIELRRQWSDHARKNFIKFNQVPEGKNSTLPVEKPDLTTTTTTTTTTSSTSSTSSTSKSSSQKFHHLEILKNIRTHNSESPIPTYCCRQLATNFPLNLPFPRSGNNFFYPRSKGGCLCQPMPKNGSPPIRIDVRAIKECTCECPSTPECACPPSERRFLSVKKHCPNDRFCRSPMFRFPLGSKCHCKKCQQFGPFPVPCNNPCTATTKCSVGQKGCASFKDCQIDKEIPVKVIDIDRIDKIDQDQSTIDNKDTLKRQVSYNDKVEIREDAIDLMLYLFPVEIENLEENPPIDIKEQVVVVIKNNEEKVKSCPEGCSGARCLIKCGINLNNEMIQGIENIKKKYIKAIDRDGKENIELSGVSNGKDCKRQRRQKLFSNDFRLEIDDDKIEIKGIDIGKKDIKISKEISDRKGFSERCGAKCNSKDVRVNHNSNDKIKIQVMNADKKVKLESYLYEDKVSRNKFERSCGNKYASDVSKEFLTIDMLPIVNKSTGKCKSKCLERYIEEKGSKNDFLKKEKNQEIEELEKGENNGEILESDQWTFVDVEYKRPIKLLKAIDEKKNRNQRNSHQELFDYVVVKFVKRVSTNSLMVVNKLFRPSYSSSQGFGDDRVENSDGIAESILSFQGIDDHQSISTMEVLRVGC